MKAIYLITVLLIVFSQGCRKQEINCDEFCSIPERHELFKSFETEKQFKYFNSCPCPGDSISEKYLFAREINEREELLDFLLDKLRKETDEEVLTDTIDLLHYVCLNRNVSGRTDIFDLVNQTISKIPDKDERDLVSKLLGGIEESRRERLEKYAKEIEEKVNKK